MLQGPHCAPVVDIDGDEGNHDAALQGCQGLPYKVTQLGQLLHIGLVQIHEGCKHIGRLQAVLNLHTTRPWPTKEKLSM